MSSGRRDSVVLRGAMEAIWQWCEEQFERHVAGWSERIEAIMPSADDAGTVAGALAQDATLACCDVLDVILHRVSDYWQPSQRAYEAMDMLVQEMERMHPEDPELEDKIWSHGLMQQELERQERDLRTLESAALARVTIVRERSRSEDATRLDHG